MTFVVTFLDDLAGQDSQSQSGFTPVSMGLGEVKGQGCPPDTALLSSSVSGDVVM